MNNNWPTVPLIRIIRGEINGKPITNKIATRTEKGNFSVANSLCVNNYDGDSISEWEEVTAVPTSALRDLLEAWRGTGGENLKWLRNVEDAMDPVLSCLPADEPGTLDRAVTRVKDAWDAPMVNATSLPADRLSLLLDALATVQSAAHKTAPLAMVARICADWANLENPHSDALAEIKSRAEGNPVRADFIVLSSFISDISKSLADGMSDGPRGDLIEMGWYALAWAAQTIEEEDQ